jgi:DNA-binding transcriptional LysR family regulator
MTLEQLRIFVAVAYIEHFTRAAERLGISQSAVSAAIAALESRYKILLFDRSRRNVELTDAGNLFLAEAEGILGRVNLAQRRIEDLSDLRVGRIVVAASRTIASYWLPQLLVTFRDRYPGLTIDLLQDNSAEVERRVSRGEVDIGIIERDPNDRTLRVETLARDTLVVVIGPRHAWFKRPFVDWRELADTSWILREPGSDTRALFEDTLTDRGVSPERLDVTLTLRSGEAICSAVVASASAAVMSSLVCTLARSAGLLQQLDSISIERNFSALHLPGRPMTRATRTLLDHLRSTGSASSSQDLIINCV